MHYLQIIMGVMCLSYAAMVIILQCMWHSIIASTNLTEGFAETPSFVTINIENGMERDAVFRCRHQRIDAVISWDIKGSSSRLYPDVEDGFIRDSNGTRVDTLNIPAIPAYNGTEVVCAAIFVDDGSPLREVTPPAGLKIIVVSEAVTQPPPLTTMEPNRKGFAMTPSSLNKTVEQGVAVFHCQHNSSDGITWRVNGTSTSKFSPHASTQMVSLGDTGFETSLSIATLPGFNNTVIECGAVFVGNSSLHYTLPALLLIQDIPNSVNNLGCKRNYSSGILTTFWDPLPTFDITGRDPDILYFVAIFKTTCGQNILMSDENVTESIINNPLDLMEIYTAIIIPRNNVPGHIDGPKEEMREKFMRLRGKTLFELSRGPPKSISNVEPVPHYYTMILESLDGIGGNMQININVQRDGEMIILQIESPLPLRHLWNASILPYSCEADMQVTELSTHDIQNIHLDSTHPGQIEVTGEYVDEATANGTFLIVYSLTNESDIQYIYIAKQPEQNYIIVNKNVTGLIRSEYGVSVFAMENGLPFPRVVTSPRNVTVEYGNDQERTSPQQTPTEFELGPSQTGVCITCTFPKDSSITDCVAVVHQRISQLSSSGLMNIESSHKLTRSGDAAYGCIEGINLEQYQVGVINGKRIMPTMLPDDTGGSSQAGAIVGAVLAVISFTLMAVVMIGILVSYKELRKRCRTVLGPLYSVIGAGRIQSDAEMNAERGSDGINHYVGLAQVMEETVRPVTGEHPLNTPPQLHRVVEDGAFSPPLPPGVVEDGVSTPPLPPRVVGDGASTPHAVANLTSHDSCGVFIQDQRNKECPPDKISPDNCSSNPTYSQPVLSTTSNSVTPPGTTEKLIYDDIQGYRNQQGQIYALPQVKSCAKKVVDDLHVVVYSEVQIQSKLQGEAMSSELHLVQACDTGNPTLHDCVTVESLFSHLLPYASKWQSLGETLSLDEDLLDEIYTNNQTDEACLQVMIEHYMMRTDLDHSWEEIKTAVKKTSGEVAIGVQESSSLSISSPMFNGSTIYTSDMHAKTGDLKSAHLPDVHAVRRCCKTSHHVADTAVNLGTKWLSMEALPTNKIHGLVGSDSKSEPIIPFAQGCATSDDIAQCSLASISISNDDRLLTSSTGTKWCSMKALPTAENNKIHGLVDHDFKSEPVIPFAQGCATSDNIAQCSLASKSVSIDDRPPATTAANNEGELRKGKIPGLAFPTSFNFPANYSVAMFVAMDGLNEAKELLQYIPCQESFEEATDYYSTLINQLGIGREKPSTMKDCQESSQDENLDVQVDIQFTTLVNKKEQKPEPQMFSCQLQEVSLLMLQVTKTLLNFCERALYGVMSCKLLQSLDTFKSLNKVLQSSYCSLKCSAVKSVIFTAIQYTRINYAGSIT